MAEQENECPVTFPCEREGVLKLLPHRDPFVWVSRVKSCVPGVHVVAELDVDPELPLFKGHFPGQPVLPGVILMEALAQAASCCLLSQGNRAGHVGYFASIDKAKFRRMVLPGDTVELEATITKNNSRMCAAEVVARVDGEVCAQAVQKYVMAREKKEE
jgi:3-hydroxyacyl-[acyl-carrier-protein] dehydratase